MTSNSGTGSCPNQRSQGWRVCVQGPNGLEWEDMSDDRQRLSVAVPSYQAPPVPSSSGVASSSAVGSPMELDMPPPTGVPTPPPRLLGWSGLTESMARLILTEALRPNPVPSAPPALDQGISSSLSDILPDFGPAPGTSSVPRAVVEAAGPVGVVPGCGANTGPLARGALEAAGDGFMEGYFRHLLFGDDSALPPPPAAPGAHEPPTAFYGVSVGRQPGVYSCFAAATAQVTGYRGGCMKKFKTLTQAREFVEGVLPPFPTTGHQKCELYTVRYPIPDDSSSGSEAACHMDGVFTSYTKARAMAELGCGTVWRKHSSLRDALLEVPRCDRCLKHSNVMMSPCTHWKRYWAMSAGGGEWVGIADSEQGKAAIVDQVSRFGFHSYTCFEYTSFELALESVGLCERCWTRFNELVRQCVHKNPGPCTTERAWLPYQELTRQGVHKNPGPPKKDKGRLPNEDKMIHGLELAVRELYLYDYNAWNTNWIDGQHRIGRIQEFSEQRPLDLKKIKMPVFTTTRVKGPGVLKGVDLNDNMPENFCVLEKHRAVFYTLDVKNWVPKPDLPVIENTSDSEEEVHYDVGGPCVAPAQPSVPADGGVSAPHPAPAVGAVAGPVLVIASNPQRAPRQPMPRRPKTLVEMHCQAIDALSNNRFFVLPRVASAATVVGPIPRSSWRKTTGRLRSDTRPDDDDALLDSAIRVNQLVGIIEAESKARARLIEHEFEVFRAAVVGGLATLGIAPIALDHSQGRFMIAEFVARDQVSFDENVDRVHLTCVAQRFKQLHATVMCIAGEGGYSNVHGHRTYSPEEVDMPDYYDPPTTILPHCRVEHLAPQNIVPYVPLNLDEWLFRPTNVHRNVLEAQARLGTMAAGMGLLAPEEALAAYTDAARAARADCRLTRPEDTTRVCLGLLNLMGGHGFCRNPRCAFCFPQSLEHIMDWEIGGPCPEVNGSVNDPAPPILPNRLTVWLDTDVLKEAKYGLAAYANLRHTVGIFDTSRAGLTALISQHIFSTRRLVAIAVGVPERLLQDLPVDFIIPSPKVDLFPEDRMMVTFVDAMIATEQGKGVALRGVLCTVKFPVTVCRSATWSAYKHPVLVVKDGKTKVVMSEQLLPALVPDGEVLTSNGFYFRLNPDGTNTPMFARQSVNYGEHHLVLNTIRDSNGVKLINPVKHYDVVVKRNLTEATIIYTRSTAWERGINLTVPKFPVPISTDHLRCMFGELFPWFGRDLQFLSVDHQLVLPYPPVQSLGSTYIDFSDLKMTSSSIHCQVPSAVKAKVMPGILSTTTERNLQKSTQYQTSMQRLADELCALDVNPEHVANASAAVYAQCVKEKFSSMKLIEDVFTNMGDLFPPSLPHS